MVPLLDQFLAALDLGVTAFTSCDVRIGWQLAFEPCQTASLHYCLAGAGVIKVGNGPHIPLRQHSFVLLPPSVFYSIGARGSRADDRSLRQDRLQAPPFKESIPAIQAGDGEPGIVTACGEIRLAQAWTPGLFSGLRKPLIEHFGDSDNLHDRFVMLLAEVAEPRIGTRALTEALLKQCLVLLLRRQLDRGMGPVPWMAGLTDPRMACVMQALLERPSEPFTVEALARIAGMSRSAFSARFSEMFGRPPMSLLKEVRLRRASELLVTTKMSVAAVGRKVGFSSRSNFSHAYRDLFGTDPSSFRSSYQT